MYEAGNDYIYDAMVIVMHVAIGVRGKKKKKKNGNLCKSYSWIGRALYYVEKLYGDSVAVNPLRQMSELMKTSRLFATNRVIVALYFW